MTGRMIGTIIVSSLRVRGTVSDAELDGTIIVSSLRVRGTEEAALYASRDDRVIPACAGNRLCELALDRV